jgi:uncharacterized membrane protein (GlpM family)
LNNLLTAIYGKLAGSTLTTAIGGRMYLDQAPDKPTFPYVVFFIVSSVPEKTFTEDLSETLIQFSIYSASSSATEISAIYAALKTLYDECSLTITGSSLVWMKETNLVTMTEDMTTTTGTTTIKHWAVDFEVKTSLN